jgi:hypothetical protein
MRAALWVFLILALPAGGCSTAGKDVADEDDPDFKVSPLDSEAMAERRKREEASLGEAQKIAVSAGSDPRAVISLFDVEARLVDGIERELNRIYSGVLRDSGSAYAYGDRNLDLFKDAIAESREPLVRYYRENERAFRVDRRLEGGFLVTRTLWRLREIAGTPAGLARLFDERRKELRIELQGVCFPELEAECGGRPRPDDCLKRVERFLLEFPDVDFREKRRSFLAEHAAWLRGRRDEGWNAGRPGRDAAARIIDPYIERVDSLALR